MSDNPFEKLWSMGYRKLVPIVPVDAPLSERSTLHKRLATGADGRGKAPGVRGTDGLWFGFDWLRHETTEDDLTRWHAMGAGAGVKTGPQEDETWLIGVDADTLDNDRAMRIGHMVRKTFGYVPTRIGQAPKALYLIRVDGPLKYTRVDLGAERVELLSAGRQAVVHGIHPKTGQPYQWPQKLVDFKDLPVWPAETLL